MAQLVIGGVTIPVAPSGVSRPRSDAVDRARAFDNTYRASATGNPKRDWSFSTPPITRDDADWYEMMLGTVTALTVSGDLPGGGQNLILWSTDFANAAYTKTNISVTGNHADPLGGITAFKFDATAGANHEVFQFLAAGSNIVRTNSVWVKRFSGSGVIRLWDPLGNNVTIPVDGSWHRFTVTGASSTTRGWGVNIATTGDAVFVWGPQLNDGATANAYQPTTTVAVDTTTINCCAEIVDWTPVKTSSGHRVVLSFALHEV